MLLRLLCLLSFSTLVLLISESAAEDERAAEGGTRAADGRPALGRVKRSDEDDEEEEDDSDDESDEEDDSDEELEDESEEDEDEVEDEEPVRKKSKKRKQTKKAKKTDKVAKVKTVVDKVDPSQPVIVGVEGNFVTASPE